MKSGLKMGSFFLFVLFLMGCESQGKLIKSEEFSKDGSTGTLYYYSDAFHLDFNTENNGYYADYTIVFTDAKTDEVIYTQEGHCVKHHFCDEYISYDGFPETGLFKGVVTLETRAKAEFQIELPANGTPPN